MPAQTRHSSQRPPAYRLHKARGTAVVTIAGRNHYLGPYGSSESYEKYARLIAEWKATGSRAAVPPVGQSRQGGDVTVVELVAIYWTHCRQYYRKDGKPTDHLHVVKQALRTLKDCYGREPAECVGPLALRAVQQRLIEAGHARTYINEQVAVIRRMYRWAVTEELLPVSIYQALAAVPGLKRGRTEAREPDPILPVADDVVDATLPHLPPVVADMVRLQRLTGCRPQEVCRLKPQEVDTSGDVWLYRPASHKTQHRGRQRVILIGPRAQDVLRPYLLRDKAAYCFSPEESERKRRTAQRQARRSPVQPSQQNRRKKRPQRQPADYYVKDAYTRAVARACEKAWPAPQDLDAEGKRKWRKAHRWSPNQLRHASATEIRKRYGLEAAQAVLGHAQADVTQIYAERDLQKAAEVMREVG